MLADVPAFQTLYQQLRLLIKFCACIGRLYDSELATGLAYQIPCQQLSVLDRIYCMLKAGPAYQILYQQLGLFIIFCAWS
jgi:hypothetical protein